MFRPRSSLSLVPVLFGALAFAQTASLPAALRKAPTERFSVNPGFRDWAQTAVAGSSVIGGNSSNRGGLFAVDTGSGKLKWSFRPTGTARGNPFVATKPAVSGALVIAPMGETLVAVTIATGREAWRGLQTAQSAAVAAEDGSAFVLGEDAQFHAIDAATGRDKWAHAFPRSGSCESVPVVNAGTIYVPRAVVVTAADANRPTEYHRHLVALESSTGKEQWRYPQTAARAPSICPEQTIVTPDAVYFMNDQKLYGLDRATGREKFAPVEVRGMVEGRDRPVDLEGLVDAGSVLVGVTPVSLVAFNKTTGQRAWTLPGQFRTSAPSTAVAAGVIYVQGHPGASPQSPQAPALPGGRLNAIDIETREVLWSFSRPTAEANWSFGFVTPVDSGLWVDSYQALIKLE